MPYSFLNSAIPFVSTVFFKYVHATLYCDIAECKTFDIGLWGIKKWHLSNTRCTIEPINPAKNAIKMEVNGNFGQDIGSSVDKSKRLRSTVLLQNPSMRCYWEFKMEV